MELEEIKIWVYDKREGSTTTFYVEQLTEHTFRMTDNDVFDCRMTRGTEFETRINANGHHEIIKILKDSDFITRRFFLSPKYKETDYRVLGDELTKRGGFWQVDFGSMVVVNIPKDFEFDIDEVMKELDVQLTEITDS